MANDIHPVLERVARAIADGPHPSVASYEKARAAIQALLEPDAGMLCKGMTAAEDALDTDWDSGGDGEGCNSYTTLRSDAPHAIYQAMLKPLLGDEGR